MSTVIIPHPEIPNHYEINPDFALITSDIQAPYFKWSRVIRKNYLKGRGFLGHYESERIDVRLYTTETQDHASEMLDVDVAVSEIERIMVDGTETILHYNMQGRVQTIVTGVNHDMLGNLSDQYRQHYYEFRA